MANLPADLPENWTQGQIISPNGTEVGLTEQHGYNYLMGQVNNTQAAVNTLDATVSDISEGLNSVAQESSVQEVIDGIGVTTDSGATATTGTVMGKLNGILNGIEAMPVGCIKSIQRGTFEFSSNQDVNITINAVNVNKSIVLVDSSLSAYTKYYISSGICTGDIRTYITRATLTNSTTLTLTSNYSTYDYEYGDGGSRDGTIYGNANWQVIEFY